MRNRQVIEREMYRAREDLESNLAELKHAVQEKIDVKARARVAVAKGKQAAQDAYAVGKDRAHDAFELGKVKAHEAFAFSKDKANDALRAGKVKANDAYAYGKAHPALVAGIAGGLVAAGVLVYVGRQKNWW